MKRVDIGIGILLMLLGVYLISKVREYTYRVEFSPGPGFMPFWLGVILIVLAVSLIAWSIVKSSGKGLPSGLGARLRKAVLFLCGLSAANFVLEWLGFILTVTFLSLAMMMLLNRRRWLINFTVAVCTALILHFVFQEFLEVTLPKGIFHF
jgi:putative tricarboxylic transport membrane protein